MGLVRTFLDFLYSGRYSCNAHATGRSEAALHVKMYALGDKYDILKLRYLATAEMASKLDEKTTPHKDLLETIPIVYKCTSETDPILRDVVVLSARARRAEIFMDAELQSQLADVLWSTPEFSMDMLASLTARPVLLKCPVCGTKQSRCIYGQCCKCDEVMSAADAY